MAVYADYVLEVDWTGAGDWSGPHDDVTHGTQSVECRRGRDYSSQLTGRSVAGRLQAVMRNLDGKYSSLNTASPLYGNIVPGRKVRLRTTAPSAVTLWTGYLERITPSGTIDDYPTVTLDASGPLIKIAGKQVSPAAQASAATGTILGAILDAADWPIGERDVDAGQTTVLYWYVDKRDALNAIREVEETELGFLLELADGKIGFEDRHHRLKSPHTASQATFSDVSGLLSYRSIRQNDPLVEIYNEIVATVAPLYAAGSVSVLWTLREETPTIGPGESLSWWAEYPNPAVDSETGAYVDAWTTPVATTDVTVTGVAIGDIGISATKFANSMKIMLTNNGAAAATVTLLQARGDPVKRREPVRVSDEDATSQAAYGERTYRLPGLWLPNTSTARDFVRYIVSRYKDPLPVLTLSYIANRSADQMTQALTREVSDRVTVVAEGSRTELGIDADFFIESISHRISEGGLRHEVVYELSDSGGDAGYWVLGVSLLGSNTRLAY
jgi:hypothetical protein